MNRTNQILVVALLIQIGLSFFLFGKSSDVQRATAMPVFPDLQTDDITGLDIYTGPAKPRFSFLSQAGSWQVSSHFGYPANSEVTNLLTAIASMTQESVVTTEASRFAQLKVDDNDFQRRIVLHTSGGKLAFFVGSSLEGGKRAVRAGDSDKVYAVRGLPSFIPEAITHWIDALYVDVPIESISGLALQWPATSIELRKEQGQWTSTSDSGSVPVAANKVSTIINDLASLSILEPADAASASAMPLLTVSLTSSAAGPLGSAEDATKTLQFFATSAEDKLLVTASDDSHAAIVSKDAVKSALEASPEKLLTVEAPSQTPADGNPPAQPFALPPPPSR